MNFRKPEVSQLAGRPKSLSPLAATAGRARRLAALLFIGAACGCAAFGQSIPEPQALRAEIAGRVRTIPVGEIVVPFEVDPEDLVRAQGIVSRTDARSMRAERLLDALFDPDAFGLRYTLGRAATARQALRGGEGDCLALASVFVGLARGLGLRAYYLDASDRVAETHMLEDVIVHMGHVTAAVETERGTLALDFGWGLDRYRTFRPIDDVEAIAHFYNNQGYEAVDRAVRLGGPIDWSEAARGFTIATEVMPDFARAWNNLGIALARLGRREEAIRSYRVAIERDPALAAPHLNLGVLELREGNVERALALFEDALAIDAKNPYAHYDRALALLGRGDQRSAMEALERAVTLEGDFAPARALLDRLRGGQGRMAPSGRP